MSLSIRKYAIFAAPLFACGGVAGAPSDSSSSDEVSGGGESSDAGPAANPAGDTPGSASRGDSGADGGNRCTSALPWPEANAIVCAVVPPTWPSKTCTVTSAQYGGKGDGSTDNTVAFQRAIADCAQAGGGHVIVPAGTFVSGAIHLESHIDLHLDAGATIAFSSDASKYPLVLTRHEGIELMNHSPPIYAYGKSNIGITGSGTLDFNATGAWNKNAGNGLNQLVTWDNATPLSDPKGRILAPGDSLAVANIEPYGCTNVLFQGITVKRAHWWQFHPTLSTNVIVDSVTALGTAAHTDGIDPESCSNVVIKNTSLTTGDDGIAIKAGRNNDGRRLHRPTSNVVIMGTTFELSGQAFGGAITCGSEAFGIDHVYAYDLKLINTNRFLLYMKTNLQRGGKFTDIHIDTVTGSNLSNAVARITFQYSASGGGGAATFPPTIDKVSIGHTKIDGAPVVLQVDGLASDPIGRISLDHDTFTRIANPTSAIKYAPAPLYDQVTINGVSQ
jgi:polygalacturonase